MTAARSHIKWLRRQLKMKFASPEGKAVIERELKDSLERYGQWELKWAEKKDKIKRIKEWHL